MAGDFKDLFSGHAADYAKFRPDYPAGLYKYLASLCPERNAAWDVGTGNGQAARGLAEHFAHVYATDAAEAQLKEAVPHPRVEYRAAPAERSGLEDGSVDCVTVAQAFHWFKHEEFFREVKRVAPGGLLAIWCYSLATVDKEVDLVIRRLYEDILGAYWDPERRMVEEGYRNVAVPFSEAAAPPFEMQQRWTLKEMSGYLGTWSALKKFQKAKGDGQLHSVATELREAWGDPAAKRAVVFPLAVRIFKVN